jgi:hypothetical protein
MSETTAVPIRPIKKGSMLLIWGGLGLVALAGVGLAWQGTRSQVGGSCNASDMLPVKGAVKAHVKTASGLLFQTTKAGEGDKPTDADIALLNYKGQLRGGAVFDANSQAPLPVARTVPGFSEGLKLMQRGGSYRLCIPSSLGYGAQGNERIPANSALIFDVEMLDYRSQREVEMMQQMLQQQQGQQKGAAPALQPGL